MPKKHHKKHKKTSHKKETNKNLTTIKLVNVLLFLIIALIAFGAFVEYKYVEKNNTKIKVIEKKKQITKNDKVELNTGIFDVLDEEQNHKSKTKELDKKVKKVLSSAKAEKIAKELKEKSEKKAKALEDKNKSKVKEELPKEGKAKKTQEKEYKNSSVSKSIKNKANINLKVKPVVAIVIDDVTTQREINQIKALGLKVTMSLMPPTSEHTDSAKIAKQLKFYMVHLPLEAMAYAHPEANTLHINDNYDKVLKRIKQVRAWYPKAKYLNNHTGSKFTSNSVAMDRLFRALIRYHFHFIDSRTIGGNVVKNIAKKYHQTYLKRNIFLDNLQNYSYVLGQIKKALAFARKNGYVIAIGHPHSVTLRVLKNEKGIFKGYDLEYVSKIAAVEYSKAKLNNKASKELQKKNNQEEVIEEE